VLYRFADCVLDTDRRELRRGTRAIPVGPQVFDLLLHLLQNRDRVVSKDNLLAAIWHGRTVSQSTLTSHVNAVRKALGDTGADQRLIRTIARKGFRFVGDVDASEHDARDEPGTQIRGPALPDRPSIAVLPFLNLSADPAQEYFADGVVEDIITGLSRIKWLFVIARNSSFVYKGRAVDMKQVGRELGVRYVLEGSVRKAVGKVRITGQLIDLSTGAHIWAERFDGMLNDIFDLQDQVTTSVVGAITPRLEQAEIERAKSKPTENLDAYDYFLRGMANSYQRGREATSNALALFLRAIELDPDFASAYGMAAWCYVWRQYNGWMQDRARERPEGAKLARRAVELGRDDAVALARGGYALCLLAGEFESGIAFLDRALRLNPNLATTWVLSGLIRNFTGETDLAIEYLARAMRLSPLDPTSYHMHAGTGFAHFLAGRLDDACDWAGRALREEPDFVPASAVIAAGHALAGRMLEAQDTMARLRQIDPGFRVSLFTSRMIHRPEHLARWQEGLRKAGLPE
jgi:TolB-like protein/Tfp pilus assembly protein PilF